VTTKKYETVLIEKQDGITWLIMNRPDKRNAMSPQLHIEMDDALEELAVDPETKLSCSPGRGGVLRRQDIKLYFRGAMPIRCCAASQPRLNQWRWRSCRPSRSRPSP
jgi:trans-feruloyl-CoA hydratase/vanillin synthase